MSNPFKAFYDTQVKIIKITTGGGYSDRGNKKTEELCSIMCDIQCFNGGLAEREYGLTDTSQYRMFSDTCEHITEGNFIEFAGELYKIVYKEKWTYGDMAILKREE
ncbi:MAG: hypothetical protein IJG16_02895 [Clostridia bacterium]|nr:hypothetical protein [Clostridia bacterium]